MEKFKEIMIAVYVNPKVRLAAKGLGLAIVAVIGDALGAGGFISNIIAGL